MCSIDRFFILKATKMHGEVEEVLHDDLFCWERSERGHIKFGINYVVVR